MKQIRKIGRWVGPSALCALGIVALVGCGGGSGPGIIPDDSSLAPSLTSTAKPTTTATTKPGVTPTVKPGTTATPKTTPTTKPSGTPKPTVKPSATPKPTVKPTATPKPTAKPTATATATPKPTATPITSRNVATVFYAIGTVSGGQFKQQGDGQFMRYNIIPAGPPPTPDPGGDPGVTPEPSVLYIGTYVLSNGEKGTFVLVDSSFDLASGSPDLPDNKTLDYLNIIKMGTANIAGKVSGSSGSGTISLSDGVKGTFTITSRTTTSAKSLKALRFVNPLLKR